MTYTWYKLFSLPDFLDEGLASRELLVLLESIGRASILISRGNLVGITYEGVYLPVNYPNVNPYVVSTYASFVDESGYVWLGIEVEE